MIAPKCKCLTSFQVFALMIGLSMTQSAFAAHPIVDIDVDPDDASSMVGPETTSIVTGVQQQFTQGQLSMCSFQPIVHATFNDGSTGTFVRVGCFGSFQFHFIPGTGFDGDGKRVIRHFGTEQGTEAEDYSGEGDFEAPKPNMTFENTNECVNGFKKYLVSWNWNHLTEGIAESILSKDADKKFPSSSWSSFYNGGAACAAYTGGGTVTFRARAILTGGDDSPFGERVLVSQTCSGGVPF